MKKLLKFSFLIIALACFSSCTITPFEFFDFKNANTEYAHSHAREISTKFPVTMKQYIGKDTVVNKKLQQGTKLNMLAQKREFMTIDRVPQSYTPDIAYLVETNDGSRFFTLLPEACIGMTAFDKETNDSIQITGVNKISGKNTSKTNRSSKFPYEYIVKGSDKKYIYEEIDWTKQQMLIYNEASIKTIKLKDAKKELIGKSLKEIEKSMMIADQIINYQGKTLAVFSRINVKNDTENSVLALELIDDKVAAINFDRAYKSDKAVSFIYNMLVSSLSKKIGSSGLKIFPRFSFFNTYQIGPIARIIIAVILGIVFTIYFFISLLPELIAKVLFRIKPLNNRAVLLLSALIYIAVAVGYILCFSLIDFVSLVAMAFMIYSGISSISDDLEFNRCPHCHAVNTLENLGKSDFSRSSSTSGVKSRDVFEKETQHRVNDNEIIVRKHYRKERYRIKTSTKNWKENYYCTACGENISYSKSESSSQDVRV